MRTLNRIRNSGFLPWLRSMLPHRLVNLLVHLPVAWLANFYYGFPAKRLEVIGVTGTKGKTSTTHLLYHILKKSGRRVALISSLGAFIGNARVDTGLHVTNPAPFVLQRLLAKAVLNGKRIVILEVTSHGLDQYRNWGIHFALALFTHLKSDHLRYHGGIVGYRRSKAKLIKQSQSTLLNSRDPSLSFLQAQAKRWGIRYAIYRPRSEDFFDQNREAAIAAASELGVSPRQARLALADFPGVTGRMEVVHSGKFMVVIDFAHTPDSLEAALMALRRRVSKGRLIAVFGCAGERDPGRRKMGAVAARHSELFIITAEDPRTESVEAIMEEIAGYARNAGAEELTKDESLNQAPRRKRAVFVRIPNRKEAIVTAIGVAGPGDVVGLFGKGHERSMCFGRTEYPWSEHQVVIDALKKRGIR